MAGHSKWANIQHRKGRQDAVRSKLFSKISKEITVAAKMGDPDVDKNPRLRLAVKEARSNSVPKDVIERAIKKSQASDNTSYEDIRYEGYASGGVAIIVELDVETENDTYSFFCNDKSLSVMTDDLEQKLGECELAKLIWKPKNYLSISSDQQNSLVKLIDSLENDDDVQNVYINTTLNT